MDEFNKSLSHSATHAHVHEMLTPLTAFDGRTKTFPLPPSHSPSPLTPPPKKKATAPDVALDRAARGDVCVESARALNRAKHYEGGILGLAASLHNWPTWQQPQEVAGHFHHERWPAPRPFDVPQPTSN
jgi:hypothetical protein